MLELDIVLQRFVAQHFDSLSSAELAAFDALLALPDHDFWSRISSVTVVENHAMQAVLCKIR